MNDIRKVRKIYEALEKITESVVVKVVEEPGYTGKIVVELNFNQGGISNTELFVKRKLKLD